jgi:hypothetical protein
MRVAAGFGALALSLRHRQKRMGQCHILLFGRRNAVFLGYQIPIQYFRRGCERRLTTRRWSRTVSTASAAMACH